MNALLELHRPEDAAKVAQALLAACPANRVFTFSGPMGVGKTTFIKALCGQLGVRSGMSSPSFSIVNEYRAANGDPVFHFDLYRLNRPEELQGIGFTEYLDSGHYCLVEWPAMGEGLYPPGTVAVALRESGGGSRTLAFTTVPLAHDHPA